MAETVDEIEESIDRTRERLGSTVRDFGHKLEAIDWSEHFRQRPHLFLGAAFAGGVLLSAMVQPSRLTHDADDRPVGQRPRGTGAVQAQALDFWHNVQGALMGVASARVRDYLNQLMPDFEDHYRRAQQRGHVFDAAGS
jgi:proline dehydrogenase